MYQESVCVHLCLVLASTFGTLILGILIAGEWWNSDVIAIENDMMLTGAGPNSSDAYTINGLPGPLYSCSLKGIYI